MFDQLGNLYCLFDDINRLLVDCPLEFLLFEIQQLISFLRWHWHASHSYLWTKVLRSLPHPLLLWNFCSPRSGGPTNLSCSISFMGSAHLFGPFSSLFNHLFYHFFSRMNPSGTTRQSGLCLCGICYRWIPFTNFNHSSSKVVDACTLLFQLLPWPIPIQLNHALPLNKEGVLLLKLLQSYKSLTPTTIIFLCLLLPWLSSTLPPLSCLLAWLVTCPRSSSD